MAANVGKYNNNLLQAFRSVILYLLLAFIFCSE